LVVRARLDADGRPGGRGVDGRLDRLPGVDDDRLGAGRRASGESQRERESAGGTGHASLLRFGLLRYAVDEGAVNENLASWSAVEDLSAGVVSVPEASGHEEARRRGRPLPTACGRPPSAPYPPRSAASTWPGCFAASLTRAQCLRTLPSGPHHTVARMPTTHLSPVLTL